jgi:NAD(P)-dependent dehydrogenase (short-subunit alcohol dehydrogenase family)
MPVSKKKRPLRPAQHQRRPGRQSAMTPLPVSIRPGDGRPSPLLEKVALVTGGDSGIGRAVAVAFARAGADVAVCYLRETADAEETARLVAEEGRKCLLIAGDIGGRSFCARAVERVVRKFGRLDILVNNAAEQHPMKRPEDLEFATVEKTFRTNVFAMFHLLEAALPHLKKGASIVNTTSVTAYRGSPHLIDYSATKGAIVSFTRSLALALVERGIRVNAVAPGPIWTPLIASTFPKKEVATFGSNVPMGRAGEPAEVASAFVYLASDQSSYVTGQVLHVNGGEIVNG